MKFWKLLSKKDTTKIAMYCTLLLASVFLICFYIFVLAKRLPEISKISKDLLTREEFVRRNFDIYLKKFGKKYQKEELRKKLENFENSLNEIEYLNRPYLDEPRFGVTKFSDMSPEEFASAMLMHGLDVLEPECKAQARDCLNNYQNQVHESHDKIMDYDLPHKFDWRNKSMVGPVLNQKVYCQNCWAFTIIGIMESMLLITNQTAYSRLSVQELTDCSNYTNKCEYSSLVEAVRFICKYKWPIVPESEYPLTLKTQNCSIARPAKGALISRFEVKCDICPKDIAFTIAKHGPVAAKVNAQPWQNYLGGVIQYHCSGSLDQTNHAVQVVGYDMSAPVPYFIIRNSWGRDFGDHGYVYVAMDNFMCAVGRQIIFLNANLI